MDFQKELMGLLCFYCALVVMGVLGIGFVLHSVGAHPLTAIGKALGL
jgi:hypothetical protein